LEFIVSHFSTTLALLTRAMRNCTSSYEGTGANSVLGPNNSWVSCNVHCRSQRHQHDPAVDTL